MPDFGSLKDIRLSRGQVFWISGVLLIFNSVPYISRLPENRDWILPDGDGALFLLGMVFLHAMYSLPAFPFVRALVKGREPNWWWIVTLVLVSVMMFFTWNTMELCCDPSAPLAIPTLPMVGMGIAFGLLALGQKIIPASLPKQSSEQELKEALKKAAESPGWLGKEK